MHPYLRETYRFVFDMWISKVKTARIRDPSFEDRQLERTRVRAKDAREVGTRNIARNLRF